MHKTDQSKLELFGHSNSRHGYFKLETVFQEKNILITVKDCGGNVKV